MIVTSPQNFRNGLRAAAQKTSSSQGAAAELFHEIDRRLDEAARMGKNASDHQTTKLIAEYHQILGQHVRKISGPLYSGKGLRRALEQLIDPTDPSHRPDDGDLALCACLGIHRNLQGKGYGNRYFMTPVRHLLQGLDLLDPKRGESVGDFGGGAGVVALVGSHVKPGVCFVSLEKDPELHKKARSVMRLAAYRSKVGQPMARAVQCDFLADALPRLDSGFLYEPVDTPATTNRLVDVLATLPSKVLAYSIPNAYDQVQKAILDSGKFDPIAVTGSRHLRVFARESGE